MHTSMTTNVSSNLLFSQENLVELSSMKCRRMSYSKREGADYLIHVGESNSRREFTLMQSHQGKEGINRYIV